MSMQLVHPHSLSFCSNERLKDLRRFEAFDKHGLACHDHPAAEETATFVVLNSYFRIDQKRRFKAARANKGSIKKRKKGDALDPCIFL